MHICDMVEITTLMLEIVTYKCHGYIHWLANGVAEIGNQQWPLAEESSSISQGFNLAKSEDFTALGTLRGVQWVGLGSNLKTRNASTTISAPR